MTVIMEKNVIITRELMLQEEMHFMLDLMTGQHIKKP